jgi:hypothetical protein
LQCGSTEFARVANDLSDTGDAELFGGSFGEVENTGSDERSAVVDNYGANFAVSGIFDEEFRSEGEKSVGAGEFSLVEAFTGCGASTMELVGIE